MLPQLLRPYYKLLQKQDLWCTRLAIHATRLRGYSERPVHPKHLFDTRKSSNISGYVREGITFLDLGSGEGTECLMAWKAGAARVIGVEANPASAQRSRARFAESEARIEVIEANLEHARIPLPDHSVDLINFSNVLEHLDNRVAVLREIKRIKRPEGLVGISIPNANTTWKKRLRAAGLDSRDDEDHKVEYSQDSIRAELAEAGLEIVSPFQTIIPSFPWNGLLALSAVISPGVYRKTQDWKFAYVKKHPEESIGWFFTAR